MRKIVLAVLGVLALAMAVPGTASAAPYDLPTGVFRLQNVNSNLCMDAWAPFTDLGAQVWQADCADEQTQHWAIDGAGSPGTDKRFIVKPHGRAKCLDVADASPADGAKVQIWDCNNTAAQVWIPLYLGNGWWKFASLSSGSRSCLDVDHAGTTPGDKLHQWTCLDVPQQKWRFLPPR